MTRRPEAIAELSTRQLEIAACVASGLSDERIAGRLVISVRKVKCHLAEIVRRLQLKGDNRRVLIALHHYRITAPEA